MTKSTPFYRMSEFWIAAIDVIIAITLEVLNLYAPSETAELVKFIFVQVQPVVIMIILSLVGTRAIKRAEKRIIDDVKALIADGK